MSQRLPSTPWNLTDDEIIVVQAFIKHGSMQAVAMELRRGEKAVQSTIQRARRRMGVGNRVLLALKWAEWMAQVEKACNVHLRMAKPCDACAGMGFILTKERS